QSALDPNLLTSGTIPTLNIPAAPDGTTRITNDLVRRVPTVYQPQFRDSVDGVLMAFTVPDEQALTPAEVQQRLSNTRLQADRRDMQIVDPLVLPLAGTQGQQRFTSF